MSPTRIKALRRALGESVQVFGARFARSGRTVEDWESGRRRPDKLVRQLLKAVTEQRVCGVVGYLEAGRLRCELPAEHAGYHRRGLIRWLGHHGPTISELDSRRRRR